MKTKISNMDTKIETEFGPMGPELQLMIDAILIGADPYMQKYGDEGWLTFVPIYLKAAKFADDSTLGDKPLLKIISDKDNSYLSNWCLMSDFIEKTYLNQPIPDELGLWVAKGLRQILQGKTAAKAFGIKKKGGRQIEFSEKLKVACKIQYLRNQGKSYEDACADVGEEIEKDARTVGNWIENIRIPNVSNKTLEALSRIGFYPLF